MQGKVTTLVGGQMGSEGKGAIAKALAMEYDFHVRTGAPNAGHTIWWANQPWVMRSVPCGWVNPDATLIIGAGALVDVELLAEEVQMLDDAGFNVSDRLLVDPKAGVLLPAFHRHEGGVKGQAHEQIGSTGEGCGPARMARLARGVYGDPLLDSFVSVGHLATDGAFPFRTGDTVKFINRGIDAGQNVLLEGTQGSALSVTHGPWPFVTSTDTNSAQLASDAGVSPALITGCVLVCRTFPIRVAGNSGPLPNELTWEEVGQPEERTTVTKKVRRVGRWDDATVKRSVMLNRPCKIALTFVDYLADGVYGKETPEDLPKEVWDFVDRVEALAPVAYLGTGPDSVIPL